MILNRVQIQRLILTFSTFMLVTVLTESDHGYDIPPLLSTFGSYPNPLQITQDHRLQFHPVVLFPTTAAEDGTAVPNIQILDFTVPSGTRQLATDEERREGKTSTHDSFAVGRYDELRVGLYESELFDDTEHAVDGFAGRRILHMGIDLDGPVGTPVYSFWNGSIHAVGYNAERGDYGNVIVIKYALPSSEIVYALYGHLDHAAIQGKKVGDIVQRGQMIGRMGNIHENGGWFIPHVHFQLCIRPPASHDMPGVVALQDRDRALVEYPDPRYILGPLY